GGEGRRRRRRRDGEERAAGGGETRRERGRGRERGGRERSRGERGGRERDRGRGERRAEGGPVGPGGPVGSTTGSGDGREFWEAWAEEKSARSTAEMAVVSDGNGVAPSAEGSDPGEPPEPAGELTARLYVNIGKREEATADDIRQLLSQDLGDDAARIGSVALRNTHAYVRVPEDLVDRVIESTRGKSFKERELLVERARR
ncbi:MAG TPA: DbpA RNA binding domain-containing protein, partial [Kofleriaceae bacterium]|nr:DbpA RNA binding domain-containing protein [Kofleriaceae bacterium]